MSVSSLPVLPPVDSGLDSISLDDLCFVEKLGEGEFGEVIHSFKQLIMIYFWPPRRHDLF